MEETYWHSHDGHAATDAFSLFANSDRFRSTRFQTDREFSMDQCTRVICGVADTERPGGQQLTQTRRLFAFRRKGYFLSYTEHSNPHSPVLSRALSYCIFRAYGRSKGCQHGCCHVLHGLYKGFPISIGGSLPAPHRSWP